MSVNTCDRLSLVRLIGSGAILVLMVVAGSAFDRAALAQETEGPGMVAPGTWEAHPSLRRVQAVASGDGAIWAGTDGGIFRYDLASGEIMRITTAEGLATVRIQSLAFDDERAVLWIGYGNGVLQRLSASDGQIRTYYDIERADRYPQRGINRIRLAGDYLHVATDFGIVVFDVSSAEVRDTFDRFGGLSRGQPAYDIIEAPLSDGTPGLWVGLRDGLAYAPRDSPVLYVPSTWSIDEQAPAPALALAHYAGRLHLGKAETPGEPIEEGDVWRQQPDGSWVRQHVSTREVFDFAMVGDVLYAVSTFVVAGFHPDGNRYVRGVSDVYTILSAAAGSDGSLWVGSILYGLWRLPHVGPGTPNPIAAEVTVVPNGPLSNDVLALDVGTDGTVWVAYRPSIGAINGMSRLQGSSWMDFGTLTGHDVPNNSIRDVKVDSRGMAWGGSEGGGLMRVTPDGEVVTFRADNSTLRPEPGFNVIMVFGVDEDSQGNVWVTNRRAANALHRWNPEDGWTAVPRPPGTPPAAEFTDLYIDRFDQKWVTLFRSGFLVARTDPNDPTSAEAVAVTGAGSPTTGTGLPSTRVQAFVEDLDGRVWIGTERGLATVFSPGSVIANPALAQPTWARTPDQASYFLRDLNITAMAVDPAGRKWLASTSGAWLINAEGNEVEAHFTPENSPLPSSVVVDVAVESATGKVWFATDGGVMSYQGVSIDPVARAERLRVYPNPYNPVEDPFVRVEGLVAETRVRILTADGQVVAAFDARGGAATWDGRDQRTGQPVPSGVYIIAAAGAGGEGTAYGKIAVIR